MSLSEKGPSKAIVAAARAHQRRVALVAALAADLLAEGGSK